MSGIRKRVVLDSSPNIILVVSNLRDMDWIRETLNYLKKEHKTLLIGLYPDKPAWFDELDCSIVKMNLVFESYISIPKIFFIMRQSLKANNSNIIFAHGFYASLVSVLCGKTLARTRVISTRHHGAGHYKSRRMRLLDRIISAFSSQNIAISDLTEHLLLSEGTHASKIFQLSNSINIHNFMGKAKISKVEMRKILGCESTDFVIAMVSRFVEWKGVEYCIAAFSEVSREIPNAKLVFLNSYGRTHQIEKALAKLDSSKVIFATQVEDMHSFYHSIDVLVHIPIRPSSEPFGLVYLEALASGVPSIFTRSGVLLEMTDPGRHSYLVDYESSSEVAEAIFSAYRAEFKPRIGLEEMMKYSLSEYICNFGKLLKDQISMLN